MSESFEPKRYACMKWPFLRLPPLKFESGFLTANTEEEAKIVESNEAFGIHIHPVLFKPQPVPSKPGKVEALIQEEIEEALAERQPKVHKGAIGTKRIEKKK